MSGWAAHQSDSAAVHFYLYRHGRLVEFADTAKIFTNPADKRTEDYITGRFG